MSKNNSRRQNKRDNKKIFIRLFGYILKCWYLFVPAIIMTLFSNQLALLGPKYSGEAIDSIAISGGVDFGRVWLNVGRMIVCYALSAVMSYLLAVLMIFLSQKIV